MKTPSAPVANPVAETAAPDPIGSPDQGGVLADLVHAPWGVSCPGFLRPWLHPKTPCADPWSLASQAGLIQSDEELCRWAQSPDLQDKPYAQNRVRSALRSFAVSRLGLAWMRRIAALQAMEAPKLPAMVARLLPPQAGQVIADAWIEYCRTLLRTEWARVASKSEQDWRYQALLPPFPNPEAAEPPAPEVPPGPNLWLAWACPEVGRLEPLLVRAAEAPLAGESLEVRHGWSGLAVTVTVVGSALALDVPTTEPIVRALHHHGGLWTEVAPPPS